MAAWPVGILGLPESGMDKQILQGHTQGWPSPPTVLLVTLSGQKTMGWAGQQPGNSSQVLLECGASPLSPTLCPRWPFTL